MKTENSIIISGENGNNSLTVVNSNAKYYTDKAEGFANKAEQSAIKSENSAINAQNYVNELLNNESFIIVSDNIDLLEEVGEKIDKIDFNAILNAEENSEKNATSALNSANIATAQAEIATSQATIATEKAILTSNYATNASQSATNALNSASTSTTKANEAKTSATSASQSATSANQYATNASNSASIATTQANSAKNSQELAKRWAVSDSIVENGLRSAKYYAQHAQGLSDVTYEHLRASRAYEDKGAVLSDEEGFASVQKYKHSTFDLSKFTVVGSPTITDDGVISNMGIGNYIKSKVNIPLSSKWKIEIPFNSGSARQSRSQVVCQFLEKSTQRSKIHLEVNGAGYLYVFIRHLENEENTVFISFSKLVDLNTNNLYAIEFTGSAYNFYENGIKIKTAETTTIIDAEDLDFTLYGNISGNYQSMYPQDLKQFSITVDGKEVFNGNKTGLDIIKPDDYTVVGSPTITSDGVASGFSGSNLIYKDVDLDNKSFVIETPVFYYSQASSTDQYMINIGTYNNKLLIQARVLASGKISIGVRNDSTDIITDSSITAVLNNKYQIKFVLNTSVAEIYLKTNDGDYVLVKSVPNSNLYEFNIKRLFVGIPYIGSTSFFLGSIDLNAFKIYVEGNLVYQPCLKIPYTESKTGSKIVPAYARDRVQDVYEQYGQAKYYTLDEENKNFTLPMGEIYGMMGQRALISSSVTEKSRIDIYSDKTCLICGNVTTSGTINLPIELANGNYFITLPTSVKTSTSFTTTSTGDYILIGKVV